MINKAALGENPYTRLSDERFIKEFDLFMKAKRDPKFINLDVEAVFSMMLLVEYNRRFRPERFKQGRKP